MTTVNIQAVGIYLGTQKGQSPLPVEIGAGQTLKDAFDLIQANPGAYDANLSAFSYTPDPNGLMTLSATYKASIQSRSGRTSPAGTYSISEFHLAAPLSGQTVWQYYVFDSTGTRKPVSGETPFSDYEPADGDLVIFRNVAILTGPTAQFIKT